MPIFVKTVGILIVCIAAICVFNPAMMRRVAEYFKQGKRLYIACAVRILFGALLIAASFSCSVFWLALAVGIIVLLAGIIPLALGLAWMTAYVDRMLLKVDSTLRYLAIPALILGAALIYAA